MPSVSVIAEIGINHNGSLETAKQLIAAAKEAGCDAVKFQKRTIEAVYTAEELARPRASVFGTTNGDLKRGLEFGAAEYQEIDRVCRGLGLEWSASCWDRESVAFIAAFAPPWLKVPSALMTDLGLLEAVAATGMPVMLSTGMCTAEDVDAAYQAVYDTRVPLTLLHCHSAYPSPIAELNLCQIPALQRDYPGARIGYSSHTVSPWPCLMAVALGARVVEVHLTRDRTQWGSDQAASLEPKAVQKLVEEIRTFEQAYGTPEKRVMPAEVAVKAKLRR